MDDVTRPARLDAPPGAADIALLDITVLAGGPSDEREVSIASGSAIAAALSRIGHRVTVSDISPDNLTSLDRPADIVFIALHGAFGEDGQLQETLERRGITFTGTGAAASAIVMNKAKTKQRLIECGLPTPRFDVATHSRIVAAARRWRLPVIVKPVDSGSSVDTVIARDRHRFLHAVTAVVRKHSQAMIEELIEGPELTVGILGNRALPVIEIRTKREFYDYQAKYIDDDTEYLFDIDLPRELLRRIQTMSVQAATALECRDFCRVDWMVDAITHEPFILELNTIPGFTSHSLLPKAAAKAGIPFDELCQQIINLARQRARR